MAKKDDCGFLICHEEFSKLLDAGLLLQTSSVLSRGYIRVNHPVYRLAPFFDSDGLFTFRLSAHVNNPKSTRYYKINRYIFCGCVLSFVYTHEGTIATLRNLDNVGSSVTLKIENGVLTLY